MHPTKLILGPPGCGKTTRLMGIVDDLIKRGIDPQRIAFVSFTRKAVQEAITRLGKTRDDLLFFRTIHSMCYRAQGIRPNEMMRHSDYAELGEAVGYKFAAPTHTPDDSVAIADGHGMMGIIEVARNRRVTLEDQWHATNDPDIEYHALLKLFRELQAYKDERNVMDYTDILEESLRAKTKIPVDAVLIDEAQDLSTLQWAVCRSLFRDVKEVYIAGDDDQAIYRWAGADVDQFLALRGPTETLDKSYRLPQAVYDVANRLVKQIKHRWDKQWRPRQEIGEVNYLPHLDMVDLTYPGSWLILARNTFLLHNVEENLAKSGILYVNSLGSNSVSPDHYTAIKTWERLRKGSTESGIDIKVMQQYLPGRKPAIEAEGMYSAADLLLRDQTIWHDALTGIGLNTREYYRTVIRAGTKLSATPQVRVSTIHRIKGGEADNVVVIRDMAQRTYNEFARWPDDERRVYYVALTRARQRLFVLDASTLYSMSL